MGTWDTTMPLDVTDGTMIDESDLDPLYNNVNFLRYATVFEAGARRTTVINSGIGIGGPEFEVMRTPLFTQENGYLYFVHGLVIWRPGSVTTRPQLNLHEGAGLAGAFTPITIATATTTGTNYGFYFGKYFKATVTASQAYTVGMFKAAGDSSFDVRDESWIAVLRCGDSSRMVDIA